MYPKSLNRRTRRTGFWVWVEIGCGKTNAMAAKSMKKNLAVMPIQAEWPRDWTWHPEIWSSVGSDTDTSKEASKFEPPPPN
jgi:hypothetical protein